MVGNNITSDLYLLVIKRETTEAIIAAVKEIVIIFFLHIYKSAKRDVLSKKLLFVIF
jgi:hypothetical protein